MEASATSSAFDDVLRRLAGQVGVADVDVADEHARWDVYRRALAEGTTRSDLQQAIALEPDAAMATSLVLLAFGTEPADTWIRWSECLRDNHGRETAIRRLAEHAVLAALSQPVDQDVVETWSDWLQRRLAAGPAPREVQMALAVHGRSQRVRSSAAESVRRLPDGEPLGELTLPSWPE